MITGLDAKSGTYILVLESKVEAQIQIGKLATMELKPGFYLYVGSAFGPGGVKARVSRHNRGSKKRHWHIDYLRKHMELVEVWYSYDKTRREHIWAEFLSSTRSYTIPMKHFGASDCQCISHLYCSKKKPQLSTFRKKVNKMIANHDRIMVERL